MKLRFTKRQFQEKVQKRMWLTGDTNLTRNVEEVLNVCFDWEYARVPEFCWDAAFEESQRMWYG